MSVFFTQYPPTPPAPPGSRSWRRISPAQAKISRSRSRALPRAASHLAACPTARTIGIRAPRRSRGTLTTVSINIFLAQNREDGAQNLPDTRCGQGRRVRLRGALVQSRAASLDARLSQPDCVRAAGGVSLGWRPRDRQQLRDSQGIGFDLGIGGDVSEVSVREEVVPGVGMMRVGGTGEAVYSASVGPSVGVRVIGGDNTTLTSQTTSGQGLFPGQEAPSVPPDTHQSDPPPERRGGGGW